MPGANAGGRSDLDIVKNDILAPGVVFGLLAWVTGRVPVWWAIVIGISTAALAICESLLLALNDRNILPEREIVGILHDAAAAHAVLLPFALRATA